MKKDIWRQWIIVGLVILTFLINGLANSLPLNNLTTGEISDRFDVFFVPAGYVFSIWGLIYLGQLAFAIFQAMPAQRENPRLRSMGIAYVTGALANIIWLFLWHYEQFPLTLYAMLILLGSLIVVYLRLGIHRAKVPQRERWLVHLPFSIYLGWITVATIANVTSLLAFYEWNGWGISPSIWAVIMLIAGTIIASAVSLTRGDAAYMLVIMWAFAGIAVKHADTWSVALSATLATIITGLMLILGVVLTRRRLRGAQAAI
jgi:benzodiazapine receptor